MYSTINVEMTRILVYISNNKIKIYFSNNIALAVKKRKYKTLILILFNIINRCNNLLL